MTVETQGLEPRRPGELRIEFTGQDRGEVVMKAEDWRKYNWGYDASTSAAYKRKGKGVRGKWCVIGTRSSTCD